MRRAAVCASLRVASSHLVVVGSVVSLRDPPSFHAQCDVANDEWHQFRALQASMRVSQFGEFGRHKDEMLQRKIERKAAP
eukprot:7998685-Pyramimonas_sp.AAC.1